MHLQRWPLKTGSCIALRLQLLGFHYVRDASPSKSEGCFYISIYRLRILMPTPCHTSWVLTRRLCKKLSPFKHADDQTGQYTNTLKFRWFCYACSDRHTNISMSMWVTTFYLSPVNLQTNPKLNMIVVSWSTNIYLP